VSEDELTEIKQQDALDLAELIYDIYKEKRQSEPPELE